MVLRNFSLTIEPGQTVALVGQSGSGKSTIIGLLERFYDLLEGEVLIDGVPVTQWNLLALRDQIGLVQQVRRRRHSPPLLNPPCPCLPLLLRPPRRSFPSPDPAALPDS